MPRSSIRRPALERSLINCSFGVLPSEWYENCPYAVLEAFALGTPVVASAIGGIPELVEDGISGLLVSPGDPRALAAGLQRMLECNRTLSDMGRAGRECVEGAYNGESHFLALSRAYARAGAPLV